MAYARDTAVIATPIGAVRITGDTFVHAITIEREALPPRRAGSPAVIAAAEQLEAWFAGALTAFDLALLPARTPRGQALRDGLIAVGYARTLSYGTLAQMLDSGARAIGQLCSRNPFPIVVPCHRVLGANDLGHYSGGNGLSTKRWLIDFEARNGACA